MKQICERSPTCPVVVLTDAGQVESTLKRMRAGVLDYLQQPIDAEAFAEVLQRAIHGLPASVDDASGGEPAWRLLHIYGDGYDSWLLEYKADGRIGPAGGS
ncbi:MAG TPA: hypothetical protein VK901_11745 [Nitrospiraceae bacterium]|nr:hypothetical protein [Nitrospiraceae bacterium]